MDNRWSQAMDAFRRGDRAGALYLYKSLAASGDHLAFTEIGNIYELGGEGVARDFLEAARWYRKAVFESGDADAHLALARLHFNGQIASNDAREAFWEHSQIAASHGKPLALLMCATALEDGRFGEIDLQKADEYYKQAAAHGFVMATKRSAVLAIKGGKVIEGLWRFIWSGLRGLLITLRNPRDRRLAGFRGGERR